jgi:endonuclease YncB( thermonuclease family)
MPYRMILPLLGLGIALAVLGLWLLQTPKPAQPAIIALAPISRPAAPPPVAQAVPRPAALPGTPVPTPAPAPVLPPLQRIDVATQPERAPPSDDDTPVSTGRPLDLRNFETGRSATVPVPVSAGTGGARQAPRVFSGPGRVTSATGLIVGHVPVELFGIRHSVAGDRCGGSDCERAAMAALQARLAHGPVSCHSPLPNQGVVAFAICLDANGVDLGGMLVSDGLALANPGESSDYVGAQSVAHDLRHGLWQSR